jgi:hypothetical protein
MAYVVIRRRRRNFWRRDRTCAEIVQELEGPLQLANRKGRFDPVLQVLLARDMLTGSLTKLGHAFSLCTELATKLFSHRMQNHTGHLAEFS